MSFSDGISNSRGDRGKYEESAMNKEDGVACSLCPHVFSSVQKTDYRARDILLAAFASGAASGKKRHKGQRRRQAGRCHGESLNERRKYYSKPEVDHG